jgi:ubiquinone/menaquinone biosynthesis C-methylase UbiE
MFSDPQKNVESFDLEPGTKIADIGAGSGHYAFAAARAVTAAGKVYAIDIQKDLLEKLKNEAHREHLSNIEILWADVEKQGGIHLKDAMVDAVIIANTLFQIDKKRDFITEAGRILKPKGRVCVVDWKDSFSGMGPSANHIVTVSNAKKLFEESGFITQGEFPAGAHHYGIIFRKP